MNSQVSFSEEDFSCPVCHDIFKNPVLLQCSHSFCQACTQKWWREKKVKECPVCKKIHSSAYPPCNLALKNLCETFMQEEKRQNMDPREEARAAVKILQDKLKIFTKSKTNCDQTVEHIKAQAESAERRIKEQFEVLRQFLREEEDARIAALREEEQQKSQTIKEKIAGLNEDILTLSNDIRAIEEELSSAQVSVKTSMERVQQFTGQNPQLLSAPLIDVVKHLGNLTFRVWDRMKSAVSYTPVILDPNTAHPKLVLSDDLTGVRRGDKQELPDNPERFDIYNCVVGSEGFKSGTHSWDVEVGDNTYWALGVLEESYHRRGVRGGKFWRIRFYEGKYTAYSSPGSVTYLSLKKNPQRIRVHLDCKERELSFSDLDTNAHLHTFTHTSADALVPYIYTNHVSPLQLLPGRISVHKYVQRFVKPLRLRAPIKFHFLNVIRRIIEI